MLRNKIIYSHHHMMIVVSENFFSVDTLVGNAGCECQRSDKWNWGGILKVKMIKNRWECGSWDSFNFLKNPLEQNFEKNSQNLIFVIIFEF